MTLLGILTDLNNAVVQMVSTSPLISKSSSRLTNFWGIVLNAPKTIGISVTFIFHSFYFSNKVNIFISFFHFLLFSLCGLPGRQNPRIGRSFFFFFCIWLSLVVWPRLGDSFVSQNRREVCASHSQGRIPGCIYTTFSYGQISVFCTIPSGSPWLPSRV